MNQSQEPISWSRGGFPTWAKMVLGVALVLLLMLVLFRIRTFEIIGNVRYTADEITTASGLAEGDILMGVNKTSTASKLLTGLPYVEEVVISKALPGTIRMEVKECTAEFAAVSEFQTTWLLSGEGKLLEEVKDATGFPVITGTELQLPTGGDVAVFTDPVRGQAAMDLLTAVEETELAAQITAVNVSDTAAVTVSYQERLSIDLGDGSDAVYKLQYFKAILKELPADARGIVDLSFSEGEQAIYHPIV